MKKILVMALSLLIWGGLAAAKDASQIVKQELPKGGKSVLPDVDFGGMSAETNEYGAVEIVEVTGMPFTKAIRTEGKKLGKDPWDFQLHVNSAEPVERGDVLLATFWMRCVKSHQESGGGRSEFIFQLNGAPWTDLVNQAAAAGQDWQRFFIPFESSSFYPAGGAHIALRLGYEPQSMEFGGIEVVNYGKTRKVTDLPITRVTYPGMEPDAPWRKAAEENILKNRTSELSIRVLDAAGKAVKGAKIEVKQIRSAFLWGTAVQAQRLIREVTPGDDNSKYREAIKTWFNTATHENALKAPSLAGDWGPDWGWDLAVEAANWLKNNGLTQRGHVLVWPSWHNEPKAWRALEKDPKALKATILDHIEKIAGGMRGTLQHWDVVNEPYDNHDITDILGEDSLVEWFKAAAQVDPAAIRYLNDYAILEGGGGDNGHRQAYEKTVKFLLDKGAPVQGLGMQGHFSAGLTGPEDMNRVLDRFAKFNLPILITEYDIIIKDEDLAGDFTRDFLISMYAYPAVEGVILWGFVDSAHPGSNAALMRKDFSLKPAGKVWQDLVLKKWRTNVTLSSDSQGEAQTRGHLGDYVVRASLGKRLAEGDIKLGKEGSELTLVLGATLFSDFDGADIDNNATFAAPGGKLTMGLSREKAHSGEQSLGLLVSTEGWGGGFTVGSPRGPLNLAGKTQIEAWISSDQDLEFSLRFREGNDDNDVSQENWRSPNQKIKGDGEWTRVILPLSVFKEDPYGNKSCHGHCEQGENGNNKMDLNAVGQFQIQFEAGAKNAKVFVDDVRFLD